jgi:translocation and assembly module TamA
MSRTAPRRRPPTWPLSVPPRGPRRWRAIAAAALLLLGQPPAPFAADPQPYTVSIAPTGNAALDQALAASSSLVALRAAAPVGPFALAGRAAADRERLQTALRSFGYYEARVDIGIAGRAPEDPALPAVLAATPAGTEVAVTVAITPGPLFHLRRVAIAGTVPDDARAKLAPLGPGAPAVAADVLAGGDRLLAGLRDDGYALARVATPVVTEDAVAHTLDVTYPVTVGPRVALGPISLRGLGHVDAGFIRRRLLVHQGERYSPLAVERARADLAGIGVFSSVQVELAGAPDAAGELPVTFAMTAAKAHVVSATAAYSTDLGASLGATWRDRNLFGSAEQLSLSATATQLGGSASRQPGYDLAAQFTKPDFLHRDQQLGVTLDAFREYLQAYDRTGLSGSVTLTRTLSAHWTASLGAAAEREEVAQEDVTRDYTLLALPLEAKYDSTNALLEPTSGVRAAFSATPTESLGRPDSIFVLLRAAGSTYLDLSPHGAGASVLALRGLVGTAQGASQFALPPDQRFYAGGSATVRGFKYQSVGPLFADDTPQGGTAVDAGTVEFRQRLPASLGAAVFVDAGQVSAGSTPFTGRLRIGAGAGLRYYTSIGPIRLDFAVPVNRAPGGDRFELYIGLGEAF